MVVTRRIVPANGSMGNGEKPLRPTIKPLTEKVKKKKLSVTGDGRAKDETASESQEVAFSLEGKIDPSLSKASLFDVMRDLEGEFEAGKRALADLRNRRDQARHDALAENFQSHAERMEEDTARFRLFEFDYRKYDGPCVVMAVPASIAACEIFASPVEGKVRHKFSSKIDVSIEHEVMYGKRLMRLNIEVRRKLLRREMLELSSATGTKDFGIYVFNFEQETWDPVMAEIRLIERF